MKINPFFLNNTRDKLLYFAFFFKNRQFYVFTLGKTQTSFDILLV